jgi:hypothetical protein
MRLDIHVENTRRKNSYRNLVVSTEGERVLDRFGIDGKNIMKRTLKQQDRRA